MRRHRACDRADAALLPAQAVQLQGDARRAFPAIRARHALLAPHPGVLAAGLQSARIRGSQLRAYVLEAREQRDYAGKRVETATGCSEQVHRGTDAQHASAFARRRLFSTWPGCTVVHAGPPLLWLLFQGRGQDFKDRLTTKFLLLH